MQHRIAQRQSFWANGKGGLRKLQHVPAFPVSIAILLDQEGLPAIETHLPALV